MNGPEGFSQCTHVPSGKELIRCLFYSLRAEGSEPTAEGQSLFQNKMPHIWKWLALMGIWDNGFSPWGAWLTCRSPSVVLPSILPLVSFWVQSVWCECLTARLHFVSQLLWLHLLLHRFLQGEGTGAVHSHEVKTKCWVIPIWLLCVISQFTPRNMHIRSDQNVL